MISILHIISDTNIGGGGRSLLNFLQYYDRSQYTISVALPRGSALCERILALNVPIFEMDALVDKSLDFKAFSPIKKIIRQVQPNLVHTHGALIGRIAAKASGTPVLYTKHCAFPPTGLAASALGRCVTRILSTQLSDGVIAVGTSAKDILIASGIPEKSIYAMLNGVAPLTSPTPEERATYRSEYGFADTDFVVGILARVEEYKGHAILLDAITHLISQGRCVHLLVAGEGNYLDTLQQKAQQLPENTVHFTGFVSHVEQALGAMDVQVNASYLSETSSLSLLEGMSMGLPAVVSDIGGNPHIITHGENGLVFPSRDSVALSNALASLMDSAPLRVQMGMTAKKIFSCEFTGEVYTKNIEAVYRDVLKGDS